jgi:hypothetical protein
MQNEISRRLMLKLAASGTLAAVAGGHDLARAMEADAVTIGWPLDVPGSQPAFHSGCPIDLQNGLRPAARPDARFGAHALPLQKLGNVGQLDQPRFRAAGWGRLP